MQQKQILKVTLSLIQGRTFGDIVITKVLAIAYTENIATSTVLQVQP